jgi:hypothetical protein
MSYQVNRAAVPYLSHVGLEKTPVFILDNFLQNLGPTLLHHIEKLNFSAASTYYPGIQAKLPEDYIVAVVGTLMPTLKKIYSIPGDYKLTYFDSYYSLVTHAESELSIEQQIPHFDGTERYRFALLHYLNPSEHGGTAFYRHNPTGIERVSELNADDYLSSVSHYFHQNGSPHGRYIDSSNQQFTKIGEIPYVQNRIAIYPGNFLHSGTILTDKDIDPNPITGRLTANIFINFSPA